MSARNGLASSWGFVAQTEEDGLLALVSFLFYAGFISGCNPSSVAMFWPLFKPSARSDSP